MTEIYAMALYQAFNSDDPAAKDKYRGRTLIVSGINFRLQENVFSSGSGPSYYLYIEEKIGQLDSKSVVRCGVSKAAAQPLKTLKSPRVIKLKGKVQKTYLGKEVYLDNCTLVSLD